MEGVIIYVLVGLFSEHKHLTRIRNKRRGVREAVEGFVSHSEY